jgi:hypothetical protein
VLRRLKSLHQLGRVDAETLGNLKQIVQVEVAPSPLDLTEEGPVDAASGRQGFLAQALSLTMCADPLAEDLCRWGDWLGHGKPSPYVPTIYVQSIHVPCVPILVRCGAMSARTRRPFQLGLAGILVALSLGLASSAPASSLHATLKEVPLPGATRYEGTSLEAGQAGSVWVVGLHVVWQLSSNGQVLHQVPVSSPGRTPRWDTATATADGGVSFLVSPELIGSGIFSLDHVSAAGALTSLPLPSLSQGNSSSSPMVQTATSLLGVWWTDVAGISPEGGLVSINSSTGATHDSNVAFAPFAVAPAPGGDFWLGGVSPGSPQHDALQLVSPSGAALKTLNLPGRVGTNYDILGAAAPGGGMWLATEGKAAYVSGSGKLTTYKLPYGACEAPYGLASNADGSAWLIGVWPGGTSGCRHRFPTQLIRLSRGRMSSTSISFPVSFGIFPSLAVVSGGKLWVVGSGAALEPALYVISMK